MNFIKSRPGISLLILVYTLVYFWAYVTWTCPTWSYMGFSYEWKGALHFLVVIVFCLLPMIWIPLQHKRPTIIIYWMLYSFTYIPMIIGVGFAKPFDFYHFLYFAICLLIAFAINGIFYFIRLLSLNYKPVTKTVFFLFFFGLMGLLVINIIMVYGSSLSFVSPFDSGLYDKRAEGVETGEGTSVGYSIMWLAGAFFPLLFGYGIAKKKPFFIYTGIIGFVFVYMTQADKAFLFSIIWIMLVYFLFRITKYVGPAFVFVFLVVIFILAFGNSFLGLSSNSFFFLASGLILVRLVGVSSYTSTIYYEFFNGSHPYTYYSHVSGINKFIAYPYKDIIGKEVGSMFINDPNFNANANMYITDGLIAIGPPGMIIAGLICGFVFYLLDSVSKKHELKFSTLTLTYNSVNIMNASIFTSVFSGGLLWIYLFFFFMPSRFKKSFILERRKILPKDA